MINLVTNTERSLLISLSIFNAGLSLMNLLGAVTYTPQPSPDGSISFGPYDMARASLFPFFRLLIVVLPLAIFFARRYLVSAAFVILALLPAYLEFLRDYRALLVSHVLYEDVNTTSLRILLMIANPLDYVTFILTNLLLVWLLAIALRSFIRQEVAAS